MKTTPEEITRAEKKAAAVVTHVEITTDIAIWDESVTPGLRAGPVPEKKEGQDDPKPGQQLAAAQPAKD
jgi:hypothetical protein